MKVVTSEEMREIDRATIEDYGIPSVVLMERAGLSVALKVKELLSQKSEARSQKPEAKGQKILVLCGGGNNGGDGLVAARNLHNWGFKVNVLLFAKKDTLSQDCNKQYQIAKKLGIQIEFRSSVEERDVHGVVVIDAIFGTGLSRPVSKEIADIIGFINDRVAPVVSVDIPSGISSDTGEIMGDAIKADCTVTFGLPKRGHLLYPGAEYTGRLFIEDIGFPSKLLASDRIKAALITKDVMEMIPQRQRYSHKGDYGHVLIIAGAKGKTGAALMAAKACLRSGAGLVTIGVPESLMYVFQGRVTEEMTLSLPDDGNGMLSSKAANEILNYASQKIDVIAIGPGIGVSKETEKLITELIIKSTVPMVIDADAINSLARGQKTEDRRQILKKAKAPIILTPHPGEMARLIQKTEDRSQPPNVFIGGQRSEEKKLRIEVEKNRLNAALEFSKETGVYLVLKGAPTIVAEPDGNVFINTTGNPGMATAGSGDVLTGIIASMLGQKLSAVGASLFGVYIHGLAGDIAASKKGEHSLIASDIINFLPDAFLSFLS